MDKQKSINLVIWNCYNNLRGKMDIVKCRENVLSMLFLKYISDCEKEDGEAIFESLYNNRCEEDITKRVYDVLENIEKNNGELYQDIFSSLKDILSRDRESNEIIRRLLEAFNSLDLSAEKYRSDIGNIFESIMHEFASYAGRKGNDMFTPLEVSKLLALLLQPSENDTIYDPACGSGSTLLKIYDKAEHIKIYGQEIDESMWSLCKMNMVLHGIEDVQIWHGDTLIDPKNIIDNKLMKFQIIVSNPPFSLQKWDKGFLKDIEVDEKGKKIKKMSASMDRWNRFSIGVPPSLKGDYAFVLHMLSCLDPDQGRMAVVLPHGVLFRGASERDIRQELIKLNVIDTVIGLPENLFYGTSIPACILILKKKRTTDDVLFVDASNQSEVKKVGKHRILTDNDISHIVEAYNTRESEEQYAYVASHKEIVDNDFNLSIQRYVRSIEEEKIDTDKMKLEIEVIEKELEDVQRRLSKYL